MSPSTFSQWRPHPWHGLDSGRDPPNLVQAYIEITPFDVIKYEVDKATGYLRVDRPQRSSSLPPALYGFIPRTYCATHVAALSPQSEKGDEDPLDVCVLSERPITRAEVVLDAKVLGGFQMVDDGEADDKIIAVLEGDMVWNSADDLADLPHVLVERLRHYFSTYKLMPDQSPRCHIIKDLDREAAQNVVLAAMQDYAETFGPSAGT